MSAPVDPISVEQILKQILTMPSPMHPGYSNSMQDVKDFLLQSQNSLSVYANMFAKKAIDQDELESLVKGLVDLAELHHLKEQILEAAAADKLRAEIVSLVATAIGETVKIGTRATV
jgi:hypothetical protein